MTPLQKQYKKSLKKMSRKRLMQEAFGQMELGAHYACDLDIARATMRANEKEIENLESFLKSSESALVFKEKQVEHRDRCLKAITSGYDTM